MPDKKFQIPKEKLDDFLVEWNLKFRCDRIYRKKYNIPFGSEQHLECNHIDMWLDLREDELFDKAIKEHVNRIKALEEYKKTGKILREQTLTPEEEDELLKGIKY